MPLLDTNVVLRHLLADDADQSPRANRIMRELAAGSLRAVLTEPVIFEIVFTLERRERHSRAVVREILHDLLHLRGVIVNDKALVLEALDLHAERGISLVDAYIGVWALRADGQVISFDRDFDRIPGLERIEP